jgi:DNA-binding IclR family transcriptional regulator
MTKLQNRYIKLITGVIAVIQSVERALALLEGIAKYEQGARMTDLAFSLGLNKSTTHHLLATLEEHGYVRQDAASDRYFLGLKFVELMSRAHGAASLIHIARPFLQRLANSTGEAVNLVVLDRTEAIYLDKVDGTRNMSMQIQSGRRAPLYCSAAGKVLLAFAPAELRDEYLKTEQFTLLTATTISSPEGLSQELQSVVQKGYAIDNEEQELGARCMAAPVFGLQHELLAAISVSAPTKRFDDERMAAVWPELKAVCTELSRTMGDLE